MRQTLLDLFDEPLIPGLRSVDGFVADDEADALIRRVDALDLTPFRFQGWEGKRLTHSFGLNYDFDRDALAPTAPLPEWLTPVRDRAERVAELPAGALRQALLIRYAEWSGPPWGARRRWW